MGVVVAIDGPSGSGKSTVSRLVAARARLAQVGARLKEDFTIKKGKIRGEESNGMLCSEDELGIGSDKDGIIILPDAPVGVPFKDYLGINDTVFELEITPNKLRI